MRAVLWSSDVRRSLLWLLIVLTLYSLTFFVGGHPDTCSTPNVRVGTSCAVLLR